MKELEVMTETIVAAGKGTGYVKPCDDCKSVMLFDRYALTEVLTEWISEDNFDGTLYERWEEIERAFVKREAFLHVSGVVHAGKVVEPREGPPEDRADYELVCQDCYHERDH